MSGRGQGKNIRKRSGGGRGVGSSNSSLQECNGGLDVNDAIGSNTNSPFQEELFDDDLIITPSTDQGGSKRKFRSKFENRVELVLNVNEVADPTQKEPADGTAMNPPQRMRTKYMHASRERDNGTPQIGLNSSQASATSAKRHKGQRGKYRSLVVEKKTRGGQLKLEVEMPDFVLQAIGDNARNLVNFCGYVVRTTGLMNAEDWDIVAPKHGEAMWNQLKNKFQIKDS